VLQVHPQLDGGRRLELRGELDLDSIGTMRAPLLDQLQTPGWVTLDLRAVNYLSSAGVGLLIDVIQNAAKRNVSLQVQLAPRSLPARILALTGLELIVPLMTDAAQSPVS
jgi:anti-anti-sigma factor